MTNQIENGDVLEIKAGVRRLVYLGEGVANVETFIPERGATGGLTNTGTGKWIVDPAYPQHSATKLTEQQIAYWVAKKGEPTN